MSLSSLKAAIGVGMQSARNALATDIHYIPVLSANVTGEQMVQPIPPEVGGSLYSRGVYKAGMRSRGELAAVLRPNTVGWLLAGEFGRETVAAAGALYDHVFTAGDDATNKWMTVQRLLAGAYGEQMRDGRVGSFRLEAAAANVVQGSVQLVGGQWEEIPSASVYAEDDFPFVTCVGAISEAGSAMTVDSISVDIGAQLTDNEFTIGSYTLDDITMLQRALSLQISTRLKSRDMVAKVYRNNAVAPTSGQRGAWSPIVYRTSMTLQFNTAEVDPQFLKIELPGVNFVTFPVQVQGADLIRAQLTAMVSLAADNFDPANPNDPAKQPVKITLRNKRAQKYSWDGN